MVGTEAASTNQLTRVEAYSDGVFAIAATLLVIEIEVPSIGLQESPAELWRELATLWPSYVAFVLSFVTIFVMWVSHYNAIRLLTGTSHPFLYANGLLLLTIVFLPFPTAVLARSIATDLASAGVVFYAAASGLISAVFMLWFAAMQRPVYLIRPEFGKERVARIWRQMWWGLVAYVIAATIGWWWPMAGLAVMIGLSIFWTVLSIESGSRLSPPSPPNPDAFGDQR
jgi:uncharacterized membrane protein